MKPGVSSDSLVPILHAPQPPLGLGVLEPAPPPELVCEEEPEAATPTVTPVAAMEVLPAPPMLQSTAPSSCFKSGHEAVHAEPTGVVEGQEKGPSIHFWRRSGANVTPSSFELAAV